jgi:hypothetical protein
MDAAVVPKSAKIASDKSFINRLSRPKKSVDLAQHKGG